MHGLTRRQLASIVEVVGAAGVPVWLSGGWAMDFQLGAVTRPHVDVDWYRWAAQIEFKQMYPVWMPERPRRAKDTEDLARLREVGPADAPG
ncbi:hypothetical protein AB0C47_22125 [Micromonospora taraxaci]|uniref:nucleotidyltransferase domain-containing protein n=1 Tax=Micromonospora taraxaci TaxID=1316803 RepID=UPI0033D6F10B